MAKGKKTRCPIVISYYLIIVFLEIRRSRGEQGIQEVFFNVFAPDFFLHP